MRKFILAAMFSLLSLNASASVIYTYTGNNFDTFEGTAYDASMKVTGTIELESLLPVNRPFERLDPISYSFTDGLSTITDQSANIIAEDLFISTDALGNISDWWVILQISLSEKYVGSQDILIATVNNPDDNDVDGGRLDVCLAIDATRCTLYDLSSGSNLINAGTWASVNTVPIPSAVWLFGSGLIGLIGLARRKSH